MTQDFNDLWNRYMGRDVIPEAYAAEGWDMARILRDLRARGLQGAELQDLANDIAAGLEERGLGPTAPAEDLDAMNLAVPTGRNWCEFCGGTFAEAEYEKHVQAEHGEKIAEVNGALERLVSAFDGLEGPTIAGILAALVGRIPFADENPNKSMFAELAEIMHLWLLRELPSLEEIQELTAHKEDRLRTLLTGQLEGHGWTIYHGREKPQ